MQRTEAVSVGCYIDASPQIVKGAGAATRRIDGVICLAAKNIDEPFLNRALGLGTVTDATPRLLDRIERFYESIGKPPRVAIAEGFVPRPDASARAARLRAREQQRRPHLRLRRRSLPLHPWTA